MYCTGCGRPIDIPISPDQKIETAESEKTTKKTRLIREDELELKVGDTVVKRNGMGYGYSRTVVKIDIIPNTGVRVWTGPANYDWYQDLVKETTVKRVETHTDLVHTFLEAPVLEVPLPERGIFKRGDEVYWDTAQTALTPKAHRRYEIVASVNMPRIDFVGGGWAYEENCHHLWEETDEPTR